MRMNLQELQERMLLAYQSYRTGDEPAARTIINKIAMETIAEMPLEELFKQTTAVMGMFVALKSDDIEVAQAAVSGMPGVEVVETDRGHRAVDRLAQFITENIPGEPSQDEGAVDTAIRLLEDYLKLKAH